MSKGSTKTQRKKHSLKQPTRKLQIIDAYLKCVEELGPDKATANRASELLGIPPSLVFYHFKNQEGLDKATVEAIVSRTAGEIEAKLNPAKAGARKTLEIYCNAHLDWAQQYPSHIALFLSAALRSPSHTASLHNFVSQTLIDGENKIQAILTHGIQTKEFKRELNAQLMAKFIHEILIGKIVKIHANLTPKSEIKIDKEELFCFLTSFLGD